MSEASADQPLSVRYELGERIGRGGMGEVFLARQRTVGNRVAVKVFLPSLGDDPAYQQRFRAEATIGVNLSHPNIAQVLDAGRDPDGRLYIVFEYVEGEDLRAMLRAGPLDFADARAIALSVADALAYAHAQGVVHRDLKPENIRVRRALSQIHVKVLDFGIARVEGTARLTVDGTVAGTPAYMSPEQVMGDDVDARADVYGLGLIFFELLTGKAAVQSKGAASALMAQLNSPLPLLKESRPDRDWPAVDALLARACAKDFRQRLPSMEAFAAALKALELPNPGTQGAPLPAADEQRTWRSPARARNELATPPGSSAPTPGARRWPLGVGVALALGLGGAAAVALFTRGRETPVPPVIAMAAPPAAAPPAAAPPAAAPPAAQPETPPPEQAASPPPARVPPAAPMSPVAPGRPTQPPGEAAKKLQPGIGKTKELPPPPRPALVATAAAEDLHCPQLDQFDPALSHLSEGELETMIRHLPGMPPSSLERQIEMVHTMSANFAAETRACQLRAQLVAAVVGFRTALTMNPLRWAHLKSIEELRALFLQSPLTVDWTSEQRGEVLRYIDANEVRTPDPRDVDFLRHLLVGELIACQVTPEVAARLKATKPASCRTYSP